MEVLKRIDNAGEALISAIRTGQNWVVSVAETVGPPIARRVPAVPLPDALRPPRARAVAESAFGFWQRLIRAQTEFTLRLLDAFDPAANHSKSRHAKAS